MARLLSGKPAIVAIVVAIALVLYGIERGIGMNANEMVAFSILFALLASLIYLAYRFGRDEHGDHEH